MIPYKDILVGCDPELFIVTKKGIPISGHDIVPGDKYDPFKVPHGAIQLDGVAAEFNIDPAKDESDFIFKIRSVLVSLESIVQARHKDLYLSAIPVAKFSKRYWETIPEDAKLLGCQPDFDAYTLEKNKRPETEKPMRTGAGHIHLSWGEKVDEPEEDKPWMEKCAMIVRALDEYLYPQSKKWDDNEERRELYGKIGAFRPKTYGLEYRVLSNAWLNLESSTRYVFRTSKLIAWDILSKGECQVIPEYTI